MSTSDAIPLPSLSTEPLDLLKLCGGLVEALRRIYAEVMDEVTARAKMIAFILEADKVFWIAREMISHEEVMAVDLSMMRSGLAVSRAAIERTGLDKALPLIDVIESNRLTIDIMDRSRRTKILHLLKCVDGLGVVFRLLTDPGAPNPVVAYARSRLDYLERAVVVLRDLEASIANEDAERDLYMARAVLDAETTFAALAG